METIGTMSLWMQFLFFILCILVVDLFVMFRNQGQPVSVRSALTWSAVWVVCSCLFGMLLWAELNIQDSIVAKQKTIEFFTGYIVELSLSVDNLFVFLLIFETFKVPKESEQRVLLYGVFGAIVMRLIFIVVGSWLVSQFHWILYLFGIFLVYTGIKMLFIREENKDIAQNPLVQFFSSRFRLTSEYHSHKFFVKKNFIWYATPLLLVVILIEVSDVIFAFDSIPAVFSITCDPFIVFTSNIFAVMGLRSLYFLLAFMASRFYLLKYGIAIVLVFVGAKMLIEYWFKVPIVYALLTIVGMLLTSVVLSLLAPVKEKE